MSANQSGFVLVSTIWLTLIMLVFAGLFNVYASRHLDAAIVSKARIASNMQQNAQEQTLIFLFATHGSSRRGLELEDEEFIKLDGSEYRGFGDTFFRVNEYSGLVGLNSTKHYHLENILKEYESSGIRRRELIGALVDYIDSDETASLSGKEAPAYRVAGMALPPNDYLLTTAELTKVYGWSDWLQEHPQLDLSWLSTNWRSRININTVPEPLLTKLLPLDERDRKVIVERRRQQPFRDMSDFSGALRLRSRLDEDFYTFLPTEDVRFRIYSASSSKLTTLAIRFTPLDLKVPWQIDYRYESERNFDVSETEEAIAKEGFAWQLSAAEDIR